MNETPWWLHQIFQFGVPTAILGLVMYAIWHSMSWLAQKIFLPATEKHIEFLAKTSQAIEGIEHVVEKIDQSLNKHTDYFSVLEKQVDTVDKMIITQQALATKNDAAILSTLQSIDEKLGDKKP